MVRHHLFPSTFSQTLTCVSGIVHGEITHPISTHQKSNPDDDTKYMTSQLWMLFGCSSLDVDAVFYAVPPGLRGSRFAVNG